MVEFSSVSITSDFGDYMSSSGLQEKEIIKRNALRQYFLTDLKMSGTGNLFSERGDLATVGGLDNIAQALTHRLMTDRGTHPMDTTLGVPWSAFIGQTYSSIETIKYELIQEIVSEIYKDSRVREVTEIGVEFIDLNTVTVDITVAPTGLSDILGISFSVSGIR